MTSSRNAIAEAAGRVAVLALLAAGCGYVGSRYSPPSGVATEDLGAVELVPVAGASGFITHVDDRQVDTILQFERPKSVTLSPGTHTVKFFVSLPNAPGVRRAVTVSVEPGETRRILAAVDYRRAMVSAGASAPFIAPAAGSEEGTGPRDAAGASLPEVAPAAATLRVEVRATFRAFLRLDERFAQDGAAGGPWLAPGEHFYRLGPREWRVIAGIVDDEGVEHHAAEPLPVETGFLYEIVLTDGEAVLRRIDPESGEARELVSPYFAPQE
ncbi:MAG: hypothetical protein HY719_07375 [Planctomycetes bacterium]|nr:hypothetical protein [Planctomycetota bacterium]